MSTAHGPLIGPTIEALTPGRLEHRPFVSFEKDPEPDTF